MSGVGSVVRRSPLRVWLVEFCYWESCALPPGSRFMYRGGDTSE
jgi:hypothetical protein